MTLLKPPRFSNQPEFIKVEGSIRTALKNKLAIIDFQIRNMDMIVQPHHEKMLEETNYLVENNLPIPRMTLYSLMPEGFIYAIEDLADIERKKIQQNRVILGLVR